MSMDVVISKPYPAVVYEGTEIMGTTFYYEDREIDGVLYRTQNASFDGSSWSLWDSSNNAYATAQDTESATIVHYFMPAGSPSWTTWTVSGKISIFNVRDYGATGNGTTDDSSAINLANAAAVAVGGGYIYLPSGNYFITEGIFLGSLSTLNIPITIGGDAADLSTITAGDLNSGGSAGAIMVGNAQWDNTSTSPVQKNIYIEKLGFNCNGAQNHKNQGPIYLKQVYNCGVRDCDIYNSSTHGILILGYETPSTWPGNPLNFQILRNHINLNLSNTSSHKGVYPIRVTGASIGLIQGNVIGELNGGVNTNDAIDFPGSSDVVCCDNYVTQCGDGMGSNTCFDSVFANNRIVSPGGFGISTFASAAEGNNGVSNVTITGNTVINAAKTGIRVSSPSGPEPVVSVNFAVTGNVVVLGSGSAGPSGIHIEASQGTVTGNTIDLGGTTNKGISIDPGSGGGNNVTCSGNTILNGGGSGTIGINIVFGTGNDVSGCSISDNTVVNLGTGAEPLKLPTLTTLVGCAIRNNVGINPLSTGGITSPGVPSAPGGTVPNTFPFDVDVYIPSGPITSVTVNTIATQLASGSFFVEAGGSIGVAWSGLITPTWTWIPR
jgi:hypothetical protein